MKALRGKKKSDSGMGRLHKLDDKMGELSAASSRVGSPKAIKRAAKDPDMAGKLVDMDERAAMKATKKYRK